MSEKKKSFVDITETWQDDWAYAGITTFEIVGVEYGTNCITGICLRTMDVCPQKFKIKCSFSSHELIVQKLITPPDNDE